MIKRLLKSFVIKYLQKHYYIKFHPRLFRTQLLPPGNQPALVVPLDYPDVVALEKDRSPYDSIIHIFQDNLGAIDKTYQALSPYFEIERVADEQVDDISPYWHNTYFTGGDARAAYAMVRALKPDIILEIGSGNSTKFFRRAITDSSHQTKIISIDPCPRAEIDIVVDHVVRKNLLDAPLTLFEQLQPGDFLFLDGSHITFHGTDVPYFFLRVLPRITPGVIVHLHDIFLPYEYPAHMDHLYYSEQYMLAAFLLYNQQWRPLFPVHYLAEQGIFNWDGGSFWMEKVDDFSKFNGCGKGDRSNDE